MPFTPANTQFGPYSRATTPWDGPIYAETYEDRNLAILGEVSPIVRERMRSQHGRYLAGLGGEAVDGQVGADAAYQGDAYGSGGEIYELEGQDDTFGSGIFDPSGRGATANARMGVLSSHYSLPGYAAREIPFTVSRDVTDITDDAEVVGVPPGGLIFVEHRGKLTRPAVLGPTWRPPSLEPAGITQHDQPYAFITRPGSPLPPPLNPYAPVVPAPSYRPERDQKYWSEPVGWKPQPFRVGRRPLERPVRKRSDVEPRDGSKPIRWPGDCPAVQSPLRGLGEDKPAASVAQVAFAGLLVGAATGLVYSLVGGKR